MGNTTRYYDHMATFPNGFLPGVDVDSAFAIYGSDQMDESYTAIAVDVMVHGRHVSINPFIKPPFAFVGTAGNNVQIVKHPNSIDHKDACMALVQIIADTAVHSRATNLFIDGPLYDAAGKLPIPAKEYSDDELWLYFHDEDKTLCLAHDLTRGLAQDGDLYCALKMAAKVDAINS